MKPTYEELLEGSTTWRYDYKGIIINISFHGYREPTKESTYSHEGTWCYYLILNEQMFYEDDWNNTLVMKKEVNDWGEHYAYYDFPDVDFHGGITFYEMNEYYDKRKKKHFKTIKVGCDYNHLWDSEAGYPDSLNTVLFDAHHSADKLLDLYEVRLCCGYCGVWDNPRYFYEAKNGRFVHETQLDKLKEDGWDGWLPKGEVK